MCYSCWRNTWLEWRMLWWGSSRLSRKILNFMVAWNQPFLRWTSFWSMHLITVSCRLFYNIFFWIMWFAISHSSDMAQLWKSYVSFLYTQDEITKYLNKRMELIHFYQSWHFWLTSHPTWINWTCNFRERITVSMRSTESLKDFGENYYCLKHTWKERKFLTLYVFQRVLRWIHRSNLEFQKKFIHDLHIQFWRYFQILTELAFFCYYIRLIDTLSASQTKFGVNWIAMT